MDKPLIPTFPRREMERRWGAVRAEMRKAGLDAVIGLPSQGHWDQFGADTRYLTQIGGFQTEVGVVFPLEGEVTAVVRGANEVEWWGLAQDSVKDIRPSRRSYGEPVIQRLKEIHAERVGVIGLAGLVRAPEGVVPWGTYEKIRAALPQARFENATDLMQEARSIKSAEEIAFMEKAGAIISQAIDAMMELVRPGVPENYLIAEMLREITRQEGEPITMLLFGAGGPEVPWAQRVPTARPLRAGDLINTEVEAKFGGYIAQALQPISLGPRPKELEKMFDVTLAVFKKVLGLLRPGLAFGDVVAFYQEEVRAAGFEPGEALMHGRGLGEDAPMLWGAIRDFPAARKEFKEGHVFILKPAARKGAMRDSIRAGDTVVIERNGARRLGKRELKFLCV
ncbi:MAG: M24 family metallopeptidase [Candidatus Binatia bacterium]